MESMTFHPRESNTNESLSSSAWELQRGKGKVIDSMTFCPTESDTD
jgi:hypothetical protein